jgi:hypothetical protein
MSAQTTAWAVVFLDTHLAGRFPVFFVFFVVFSCRFLGVDGHHEEHEGGLGAEGGQQMLAVGEPGLPAPIS